ncbi:hypothetical protein M569_12216, partial [Genlisea aurea]
FMLLLLLLPLMVLIYRRQNNRRLPPGPPRLPIIGNILQFGRNPHRSLADLAEKYGPLMHLKLGFVDMIVLSSPETAKQVIHGQDHLVSYRPQLAFGRAHDHNEKSVVWINDVARRTPLKKLCKEHLFSLQKLDESECLRREKIEDLRDYLHECSDSGTVVNVADAAFTTSLNMISSSFFSTDFATFDSEKSQEVKEIVHMIMKLLGSPNLADYFPFLKPFDPRGIQRKAEVCFGKLFDVFNRFIDERMRSGTRKNDLLQALLDVGNMEGSNFTRDDILHVLLDLFVAGTDTTSATVEWAMTELLRNPSKMTIVKNELKDVVGDKTQVEESDTLKLPYLEAVIKETFRLHPVAPLMVPRTTSADVEIDGYVVPKDAHILVNIWAVGRSARVWESPESFIPERFLNSKIDLKGQNFELIPFGSGRRRCLGVPLVLRVVPLVVASMIHDIDWELENGTPPEKMDMNDEFKLSLQKLIPL